jgi:hypothetical protein
MRVSLQVDQNVHLEVAQEGFCVNGGDARCIEQAR